MFGDEDRGGYSEFVGDILIFFVMLSEVEASVRKQPYRCFDYAQHDINQHDIKKPISPAPYYKVFDGYHSIPLQES